MDIFKNSDCGKIQMCVLVLLCEENPARLSSPKLLELTEEFSLLPALSFTASVTTSLVPQPSQESRFLLISNAPGNLIHPPKRTIYVLHGFFWFLPVLLSICQG